MDDEDEPKKDASSDVTSEPEQGTERQPGPDPSCPSSVALWHALEMVRDATRELQEEVAKQAREDAVYRAARLRKPVRPD